MHRVRGTPQGSVCESAFSAARRLLRRFWCWCCWAAWPSSLMQRRVAGARALQLRIPHPRDLESGHRPVRRAGADLRHRWSPRCIAMLLAVPIELRHCDVPDRAVPAVAEAADRRGGRAAGGGAQHHLRHLGPVRARARPAAPCAALADRRSSGPLPVIGKLFQGPPFGIGILTAGFVLAIMVLPVHRRDHARCVRHRAGRAEGVRLRPRRHHLGSHLEGGACRIRAPASSAASCWASGARWARPWP